MHTVAKAIIYEGHVFQTTYDWCRAAPIFLIIIKSNQNYFFLKATSLCNLTLAIFKQQILEFLDG